MTVTKMRAQALPEWWRSFENFETLALYWQREERNFRN